MTEPTDDGVPVSDRRRFTPEGELRPDAPDGGQPADTPGETPSEPAKIAIAPALVPAEEAAEWERRARDAEGRLGELAASYRRARDQMEAARTRLERDQEIRVRESLGRAFQGVLAALDNLDRALEHADAGPLTDGVRLVQRQLLDALAAEGVERIEVLELPFDPTSSEAVVTCPAENPQQVNTVVQELRAGYRLHDRVIRPAQVRVAL